MSHANEKVWLALSLSASASETFPLAWQLARKAWISRGKSKVIWLFFQKSLEIVSHCHKWRIMSDHETLCTIWTEGIAVSASESCFLASSNFLIASSVDFLAFAAFWCFFRDAKLLTSQSTDAPKARMGTFFCLPCAPGWLPLFSSPIPRCLSLLGPPTLPSPASWALQFCF